jgi:hypothetical protein
MLPLPQGLCTHCSLNLRYTAPYSLAKHTFKKASLLPLTRPTLLHTVPLGPIRHLILHYFVVFFNEWLPSALDSKFWKIMTGYDPRS